MSLYLNMHDVDAKRMCWTFFFYLLPVLFAFSCLLSLTPGQVWLLLNTQQGYSVSTSDPDISCPELEWKHTQFCLSKAPNPIRFQQQQQASWTPACEAGKNQLRPCVVLLLNAERRADRRDRKERRFWEDRNTRSKKCKTNASSITFCESSLTRGISRLLFC